MAAIVAVVLVTVAAFGIGRTILRLLGAACETPAEEIAFSVGLGYGAIAYAVFGLGLAGGLYPWALAGLLTLPALAAVREGSSAHRAMRGTLDQAWSGNRPLAVVLGGLLLISAAANLLAALAPPTGGDALTYHLAVPKIWLEEHRITALPWRWPSLGPFAVQMLYLLVMALPGDSSPSVLAWMMGIVAAVGLIGAGSKLPRPVPPLLAAGIFYTMSTVGQNAASTRVDLGMAMFVLLATLACVTYLKTRQVPWLVVAGVCAGLAAGTKHIGAAAAAVLVVGLAAFRPPRADPSRRGGLPAAGLFALVAAGVAAPWYVRSLVLTGDPVYPFLTAVLGNPALRERLTELTVRYGPGKTLADFALLPIYLTAAVGPPYLSFAPFSMALWRTVQVRFLWFVVAALAVIWFLTAQVIRFLLPALPAAAMLAALGFAVLDGRSAVLRTAARIVIVAGLATAAAITVYHDAGYARAAAGLESREAYLLRTIDNHDDIAWMNTHLPADARVLLLARYGYYLERWYIGAGTAADVDDLRRWIAEQRVSHIYCVGKRCDAIAASGVRVEVLRQRPLHGNPGFSRVLRVIGP
jgi:hypothetical protein